jgi:GAF domain-containing protein
MIDRQNDPFSQIINGKPDMVETWPVDPRDQHQDLQKARQRLEQYRAALRLARVEIERRNRNMIALTTFAYQASRAATLKSLLKLALIQALHTTGTDVGTIILIDPDTKELKIGVQKGLTTEFAHVLTGQQLNPAAIVLMPHLVMGSGALLEYQTADDELERQLLRAGNLTSLVSLPLQIGSGLLGAFLVGLQGERYFKAAELSLLMALSQETAVALENLRLREGLWHTFESLLDDELTDIDLQKPEQATLNLEGATSFELPAVPLDFPQPAEDDLDQLLAAMMEAEDEVQQQNIDLQTLNAIAEMVNQSLDLREILQFTVEQTKILLSSDAAWLYLINERSHLDLHAHVGLSSTYVRGMKSLRLGDSVEGLVVAENKAHFIKMILDDTYPHKIWIDKEGLHALAAVPITRPERQNLAGKNRSEVIGVLAVGKRVSQAYAWSPREMRLLISIANQIAPAIDNARLYAQLQEDQASLKVGNEILRSINDMLLEKNASVERIVQDGLKPALARAAQILGFLEEENPQALARTYRRDIAALQQIVKRLNELVQETTILANKEQDASAKD